MSHVCVHSQPLMRAVRGGRGNVKGRGKGGGKIYREGEGRERGRNGGRREGWRQADSAKP